VVRSGFFASRALGGRISLVRNGESRDGITWQEDEGIATLIFRYFLRYFSSTHRTALSRFRGNFHSFDPVGFAIFAIPTTRVRFVRRQLVHRFCCKSLFALAIKISFGRTRDFRVKM
jgi:hypothetical protein